MKSHHVLAAVFGVLALVSASASATTDSGSFLVSLRIAAPCDVSTDTVAPGDGGVTVGCESPSTPYRLEPGARAIESQPREAHADEFEGYVRATLTF
jgi:hypothetical protein